MIELQQVTKLYGRVIGVNEVTLSLPPGAYGLLGPNGSGKSTLLNLLTGQLNPTIGSVRVFGEVPRNNANLHRRLGFCPGSEGLYANVSSFEWVKYLQQLHGRSARDARDSAAQALKLVGMADAMHRPISSYSRGMRQRTKLAQAIAHEPEILILDEPFNGLDPVGRHDMSELLRSWLAEGKSLLIASHVLHEIETITNSFLLICGGRLLASGSSNDVHEMLLDVPSQITLRSNQPQSLAKLLLDVGVCDAISITDQILTISTKQARKVFTELPVWLGDSGIDVQEVHSPDESLQALFNSLMKIHRGELG